MKVILNHTSSDILQIFKTNKIVYINKGGTITECNAILYNNEAIKMLPCVRGSLIILLPEDEIYYNSDS
jgi:hypothetical protein